MVAIVWTCAEAMLLLLAARTSQDWRPVLPAINKIIYGCAIFAGRLFAVEGRCSPAVLHFHVSAFPCFLAVIIENPVSRKFLKFGDEFRPKTACEAADYSPPRLLSLSFTSIMSSLNPSLSAKPVRLFVFPTPR